ncbi:HEAT repeat domain-containing protein [Stieleria sp. TO1_6]|uniref:PVC-type heme-binding CxxCH protein n=1 Tax=Stieleria tagensis TaxID=2956795 RepID=UPI00209B96C8|nr:PVC-type heme-binding CxxCH protein [Stieleria tagensis]MCO8121440.1 HEAT repeat domain-containing protein [Stieleria tagensis]
MAILCSLGICIVAGGVDAADLGSATPLSPEIAAASSEANEAKSAIRIPDGWEIDVWAAEPDVANVVAFDIDRRGRVYVCETFRQERGVTDNRGHDQQWLMADLASKTVQDRIDYHKRLLGEAAITYAQHDDRIRRLTDRDGDGRADESVIVADGFNRLEEGTGAGVLVRDNDVYYTCIPKLWKLVDSDGDGKADERVVLSDGYGVRVAFRGHDMHGLIRGYDGRLYFTIGDRGYHIRTAEGKMLADPSSGAMFRCEMDGTGLEVFATGLRNPQEIAFNDQGDWFTVDNNSDSGDQARIVHLLQDTDTGWRMYYQYLPDRGPFNRERIWEPKNPEQPASIFPPVANFTDGPSGLVYYPGTGFGDTLDDTFLICDFRGGPSNSGIRSFKLQPDGATFKLAADDQPIWTCLATDVAFGPDGALYVSDWVDGWNGLGKARLYRLRDPQHAGSAIVREVQTMLADDWTARPIAALVKGLSHVDRRIRLESQWELARRGEADSLIHVATAAGQSADGGTESEKARLHAVWGLGQIARRSATGPEGASIAVKMALIELLSVADPNLQHAAAGIVGQAGWREAVGPVQKLLASEDARVRYAAIDTLGRLQDDQSIDKVIEIAGGPDADDPAIRHAASMYLSRAAKPERITELANHKDDQARLLAVIALRRLNSELVAAFLNDSNRQVVLEAARAIHDQPIQFAMPALAALIQQPLDSDPLARRVLNANFRIGTAEAAAAVAKYATRADASEALRISALDMLGQWAKPHPLDRVLGDYRPLEERDTKLAADALQPQVDLLMAAPEKVRLKAIGVASRLGIKKIAPVLVKQISEISRSSESRGEALLALARLDPGAAVKIASAAPTETIGPFGLAILTVLAEHSAGASMDRFVAATTSGDTRLQQAAWDILGKQSDPKADAAIATAVDQYIDGKLAKEVQLNVIEASRERLADPLRDRLAAHRQQLVESQPVGKWLDSLAGGDIEKGKELFFGKTELSCVRCHKVDRAGGEVGPNLTVIGKDRDSKYLLEAICLPDAAIAKGFETAVIVDIDGRVLSGIVKTENDDYVELTMNDGSQQRVSQDDIEARRKGNSSMPADLTKHMSARELRDLVAYLSSLKVDPRAASDVE